MRSKKKLRNRQAKGGTSDSAEVKVGDKFIVLRKVSGPQGVTNEQCLATIVEIRDQGSPKERDDSPVSEESVIVVWDNVVSKKRSQLYYVHYVGMDKRLDEWIERGQIIEKVKPDSVTTASILALPTSSVGTPSGGGTMTRRQRQIHEEFNHVQKSYDDMDAVTARLEKEHDELTKVKNIEEIRYGIYVIDAWYVSPYPDEFFKMSKLWICEFCMAYMKSERDYRCHMMHLCKLKRPPGEEIYRKGAIAVFEVDGRANKPYCQCLCLLSKLFLDHKALFYAVDMFRFYVLCEVEKVEEGEDVAHMVGYFSKERASRNNLSCIMVLPPFQRKGYGKFLIHLSYQLSDREGVIGTPEKPLSDLGKVSYRSYWWWVILETLAALDVEDITVSDLSVASRLAEADIMSTLRTVQLIKYWKGDYVVRNAKRLVDYLRSVDIGRPPKLLVDLNCLVWKPEPKPPTVHGHSKLSAVRSS